MHAHDMTAATTTAATATATTTMSCLFQVSEQVWRRHIISCLISTELKHVT